MGVEATTAVVLGWSELCLRKSAGRVKVWEGSVTGKKSRGKIPVVCGSQSWLSISSTLYFFFDRVHLLMKNASSTGMLSIQQKVGRGPRSIGCKRGLSHKPALSFKSSLVLRNHLWTVVSAESSVPLIDE